MPTQIEADLLREVIQRALTADATVPPVEVLCADQAWVELLVPCAREAAARIQRFIEALEQLTTNTFKVALLDASLSGQAESLLQPILSNTLWPSAAGHARREHGATRRHLRAPDELGIKR